jgi:nucleoside-diphosphate-sugar epimerase
LEYFKGDITDIETLSGLMDGVTKIIHMAACLDLSLPLEQFYKINVEGTKNIFDMALENKVKLIINTSSAVVFGGNPDKIKNEKTVIKKFNLDNYAKSKIKNLQLVDEYRKYDLNIINVYPTAVIDINKKPKLESTKLMGLIWRIAGGIPGGIVGLFGSGKRKINYVLVEDVANGIVLAMEKGKKNSDYILGGENIMIKDYLKKMARIYHSWYLPIRIPSWVVKKLWHISVGNNCFSSEKAKKEIDYDLRGTRKLEALK